MEQGSPAEKINALVTQQKTHTHERYAQAIKNTAPHRWKKGESGNPSGPKPGYKWNSTKIAEISLQIQDSIDRVEKQKNKSLLDHYVERAFASDATLHDVMKKLMPDLIKKDGDADSETNILYISVPTNYDIEKLPPKIRELVRLGVLTPRTVPAVNGNGKPHD